VAGASAFLSSSSSPFLLSLSLSPLSLSFFETFWTDMDPPGEPRDLISLCREGLDLAAITSLLALPSTEVNRRGPRGATALAVACEEGHVAVIKELLNHTALDLSVADDGGATALFRACERGRAEAANLLLRDSRTDLEASYPCFWAACYRGHEEVVRLFLELPSMNPNRPERNGIRPLGAACLAGREGVVALLLRHPMTWPDAPTRGGVTPLWTACAMGKVKIAEMLLKHPWADPTRRPRGWRSRNSAASSALYREEGEEEEQELEQEEEEAEAEGEEGEEAGQERGEQERKEEDAIPLVVAARRGHVTILELFLALKRPTKAAWSDADALALRQVAAERGREAAVEVLERFVKDRRGEAARLRQKHPGCGMPQCTGIFALSLSFSFSLLLL
jgi:hypothetical protein